MARTVKKHEHAEKRNEILDTTQRLVYTKGYERMTIQDILADLQISSGAFYHYFDSKLAVLDALIERIKVETEKPLLPIVQDPHLSALEKLQGFFGTLDRLRIAHKAAVIKLGRVWYNDDNAIVRQKVDEAVLKQRAPLLTEIVRQGIQEGVFTTAYPDQAGEVILSLLHGMGNAHAKLLLTVEPAHDEQRRVEAIVATHAAYLDAIERVLGAPANALVRTDAEAVNAWMAAL
ncbi:MAG: TetR/AcrR family transcriptional regulator [Chloroflexi bacterium]|nr:TetR/AcrR family transcriptional regulator [Chloroflexota bacterium]